MCVEFACFSCSFGGSLRYTGFLLCFKDICVSLIGISKLSVVGLCSVVDWNPVQGCLQSCALRPLGYNATLHRKSATTGRALKQNQVQQTKCYICHKTWIYNTVMQTAWWCCYVTASGFMVWFWAQVSLYMEFPCIVSSCGFSLQKLPETRTDNCFCVAQ